MQQQALCNIPMQSCGAKLVDGTLPNIFQKCQKTVITGSRAEPAFLGQLLYSSKDALHKLFS